MTPLFLLFACDDAELRLQFGRMQFAERGVYFADGSNSGSSSGTFIYRGAAFDFAISSAVNMVAKHHIFCKCDPAALQSSLALGLGAAVASGQHIPAIVKALMRLGEILGSALNASVTLWEPASVIADFLYYRESVIQYENGAAFPSLVSIGYDTTTDHSIRTTGLGWLAGQEIVFERDELPVNEAMGYVVRLVHDLATNGAVDSITEVPGMNDKERLILIPNANENILSVRRKHI